MSPELIAIILVGLSNAATLSLLLTLYREVAGLRGRLARLEEGLAQLVERVSRLEGWFERFIGRPPAKGEGDTGT